MIHERFSTIIARFCESLAAFVHSVAHPTYLSTDLITRKKIGNNEFDNYVIIIKEFNDLSHDILNRIKKIIISLNNLFIHKDLITLTEFLEDLRIFLLFLLENNVFHRLNEFKIQLNNKYDKDIKLIEKIVEIKVIIFKLFDLSIGITSVFIPQFAIVKMVIGTMEEKTDTIIKNKVENIDNYQIDLDDLIRKLLDIELRSQIILGINIETIHDCLKEKDTKELIIIIEKLHQEYIEMLQTCLYLRTQIEIYKQKRNKNLVSKIISKVIKNKNLQF